ncbi:MAG: protease inhibitor I42 family protein [Actinomycetes bacterium]
MKTKTRVRVSLTLGMALVLFAFSGANAATTKALSESYANKVVTVKLGTPITLTLHSMYWQLQPMKSGAALATSGAPILKPVAPGPKAPAGCGVPGTGCGTQLWKFKTVKVGTTQIMATRTSCGEALRCVPPNDRFSLTVKVVR